jgi:hypothetical protein
MRYYVIQRENRGDYLAPKAHAGLYTRDIRQGQRFASAEAAEAEREEDERVLAVDES